MVNSLRHILLLFLSLILSEQLSAQKIGFNEVLQNEPNRITTFCVPNTIQNIGYLKKEDIIIKYQTNNWLFITASPTWIKESVSEKHISEFYFENAPPTLLGDTVVGTHYIDSIHQGSGGFQTPYTGKDVIIGFVDTGVDFLHEDFMDENGQTRVIRIWDQTMPDNTNSPIPYGYGFVWDSSEINAGNCTTVDLYPHGTMVTGQAAGNARANGSNIGVAPDANIIAVKTDFTRPNWTLTVVDAVDYIFKVADTLNMPAVVNLSLGTYIGSHDGNDPASEMIEILLDEKPGRIVVSASGNSGEFEPYHVHNEVTADTSFILQVANSSSFFGPNTIYFDLWTEMTDATWDYSFAVDRPAPDWSEAGTTIFRGALDNIGVAVFDTIRNVSNDILAVAGIYTEQIGSSYRMQLLITNADSLTSPPYLYRFNTVGSGRYDLWSGADVSYNKIIGGTDTVGTSSYPNINRIILADYNQSITSSWNCSEKVVSVGNIKARSSYVDKNLNTFISDPSSVGSLSPKSSKGPNRHNLIKPDIVATGNITFAPAPLWYLSNPANNPQIDSGGYHMTYGGSSMSSPVVAGIAALYLERCKNTTYQDFINDIKSTAFTDIFTGVVPNNSFGYGKVHALNALLEKTVPAPTVTLNWAAENLSSSETTGNQWYLNDTLIVGETNEILTPTNPFGSYQVLYTNGDGCSAISSPLVVTVGIETINKENIQVSPNPTSSVINLEYEYNIDQIHLFDMSGKEYSIRKITDKSYSLESLPNGNYILEITSVEGKFISKIIKL